MFSHLSEILDTVTLFKVQILRAMAGAHGQYMTPTTKPVLRCESEMKKKQTVKEKEKQNFHMKASSVVHWRDLY